MRLFAFGFACAVAFFGGRLPDAADVVVQTRGGMIDTMPDLLAILDRVSALPGSILGMGLGGHGFGNGPAVGRVQAALATGREAGHDPGRFCLDRSAEPIG